MGTLYLVTGAAGNLGSSVVRRLAESGERVRALVLPGDRLAERLPKGIEICVGNVLDPESLRRFFEAEPDTDRIVIHCAGIVTTYWEFVQAVYDVNVTGTRNVVDLCADTGVRKLIYVSSVHAIPEKPHGQVITEVDSFDPDRIVGFYGKTKAMASRIVMDAVKERGLDASLVFPSGLCGPNDYANGHVTQLLIDSATGKLRVGIRGGYDFTDVRDVAAGIVACCEKGRKGEGYLLGNRYVPVGEILREVSRNTGKNEIHVLLPLWIAKLGVPFLRIYYKARKRPPIFTRYSLYTIRSNSSFSSEKARRELGYTTRPFSETVADTLAWLREEGRIEPNDRLK